MLLVPKLKRLFRCLLKSLYCDPGTCPSHAVGMKRSTMRHYIEALSRPSTLKTILGACVMITILHYVIKFERIRDDGDFRGLDIPIDISHLADYPPLGILTPETFPDEGEVKIPRIIHQTWKNTEVPRRLTTWVKSWVEKNPDWEYWLWTDESARELISERYPQLLDMYDNYPEAIRRADALRYVILYEFGGVYADMDVESLKSLDPMLRKYSCFLPQEPYEHPILYGNFEHLVINAIMGCRAKHPFMKLVIDNLKYFSHMWNVLDSTGPHFLTSMYKRYTNENRSANVESDSVYLSPAEYFFPTIDPNKHFWFRYQCSNFEKLTHIQKRACVNLKLRGVRKQPMDMSFTDHHWIHSYLQFSVSLKGPINIHSIVPSVKIYSKHDDAFIR